MSGFLGDLEEKDQEGEKGSIIFGQESILPKFLETRVKELTRKYKLILHNYQCFSKPIYISI